VSKGNRWIYDKGSRSKTLRDRHNHTVATVFDDYTAVIGGAMSWHSTDAAAMSYCVAMLESQGVQLSALTRTGAGGNVGEGAV
jgi:hypothetical protein